VNYIHPCRVHLLKGLLHGHDTSHWREFCAWLLQYEKWSTLFRNEALFYLNGHVNLHNCRCWSYINPHWIGAILVQNDPQIVVLTEIWRDQTTDSYFFDSNITSKMDLHFLQIFWMVFQFNKNTMCSFSKTKYRCILHWLYAYFLTESFTG
jgi:hypothetical protein